MGLSSSRPPNALGVPPANRSAAGASGGAGGSRSTRPRVLSHLQPVGPAAAGEADDGDDDDYDDYDDDGENGNDDGPGGSGRRRRHGRHRSRSLDFIAPPPPPPPRTSRRRDRDSDAAADDGEADGPPSAAAAASGAPRRPPRSDRAAAAALMRHLALPPSFYRADVRCPICGKTIPYDDTEMHLVMCLTKPRINYNEDVLAEDKGSECAICLEDLCQGDTIARLPCLCIYHKGCIDEWFKKSRSCPEHPGDG